MYELNKGRTFTPPATAKSWIERFNRTLEEEKTSRNKLTSELIEDGFKYRDSSQDDTSRNIHIPANGFSQKDIDFLNTHEGKQLAQNALKMLLNGVFTSRSEIIQVTKKPEQVEVESSHSIPEKKETEPVVEEIPTQIAATQEPEPKEEPAPPKINSENATVNRFKGRLAGLKFKND